jgi:hypothetical protein
MSRRQVRNLEGSTFGQRLRFEISEILEERDVRRRIAEDDEIADLDFLWNLPAAAPSLPMRPAKHTSRNRLHRGF